MRQMDIHCANMFTYDTILLTVYEMRYVNVCTHSTEEDIKYIRATFTFYIKIHLNLVSEYY